ncbi:MAG TPA: PPC domain-containing protein [Anaerolineae bacterium]|nr:PPC domain-containing protein [Anaerolineae bacterium]
MSHFRISHGVRTSLAYGAFAAITNEPTTAAGSPVDPPVSGSPDLVLESLSAYPAGPDLENGMIAEALLTNNGDRATENGFFTDLYSEHLPTGAGDLAGSIHFWIANPIQPGATMTVTTLLTSTQTQLSSTRLGGSIVESSATLYGQADSTGAVTESDDQNNISQGAEVCVATDDLYEPDNSPTEARQILGSQSHNINSLTDEDWVYFWAEAGQTYVLATSSLGLDGDTYLYLYDTDGETLLAANDDYGGTLASRIVWECPATGTYYAAVKHWNPNVSGCGTTYDLSFSEQHLLFLPLVLKTAGLTLAASAPPPSAVPTIAPTPVELATPTPCPTPTPALPPTPMLTPTLTITVPLTTTPTATPTATASPSPTETEATEPVPPGPPPESPPGAATPTPTEAPTPSTTREEEPPP